MRDAQISDGLAKGGQRRGLTRQFLFEGGLSFGRTKNRVFVTVKRKRNAFATKCDHHHGDVAFQCLGRTKSGCQHFTRGIIDDRMQHQLRVAVLQPSKRGSINLP
jgi:hypothetical protein